MKSPLLPSLLRILNNVIRENSAALVFYQGNKGVYSKKRMEACDFFGDEISLITLVMDDVVALSLITFSG
jgi:hypothetical protein